MALPYLAPEGVVVDFQNGLNDERVAAVAGKHRTLGCVITIGAGMYDPGHAMRTDTGTIGFKIGEHDGRVTARAKALAEVMSAVAETHVTTNLFGERWSKLAINCMANPMAGLSGLGSAEVRIDPEISSVGIHLGAECIMVGRAAGHEVEPIYGIPAQRFVDAYQGRGLGQLLADVAEVARKRGGGRPSLLQDVIRGRRTEIEFLNGAVCDHGRRLGVKTPFNDAVVEVVRGLGVGFKPDRQHLAPLFAMLPK
jgi:2-dehydropantoate 2-reductase